MAQTYRKKRHPQLSYSENRGIGYFVSFRDPITKKPKKHRFGMMARAKATALYDAWLAKFLAGDSTATVKVRRANQTKFAQAADPSSPSPIEAKADVELVAGSLAHITLGFLQYEESRIRPSDGPRTKNTIERKQYNTRKRFALSFLKFINEQRGEAGACNRMKLKELEMLDVEQFNQMIAANGESDSTVRKTMQCVKAIIETGERPEFGQQSTTWKWTNHRPRYGQPQVNVVLPTLPQLKAVLKTCEDDVTRTCQIWMALGLAFGQSDLSDACPIHFDKDSYDMRRGKTQRDRTGDMPPLVWKCMKQYLAKHPRPNEDLMFLTERGRPLVHGDGNDSIEQWWTRLRASLGEVGEGLNGFYSLRHLSATERAHRDNANLGDMQTFLGHSASSTVCDNYMKKLAPEHKEAVAWVRNALFTGRYQL